MAAEVDLPSWTSILLREVQTLDMAAVTESRLHRETTWSSLPVASMPLREKASAVTFPPATRTVWLLKYSTGGGSCSSAAVFEAALRSGFQVRMVESLPLEISCAVLSLAIWHNHGTGWQQKTYNAVSRYSDGENSA
jgi:hypothetical protein